MNQTPLFIAMSNQKGGVGKSTLTVLLSSYLHYAVGKNILVVDCDPQNSISSMRERDMLTVQKREDYQQLLVRQFSRLKKKPIRLSRLHRSMRRKWPTIFLPGAKIRWIWFSSICREP